MPPSHAAAVADPDLEGLWPTFVAAVHDYALLLLDPNGRIMSWNRGAELIKGYRAEEIVGRHFSCFYPPEAIEARSPERELEIAAATGRFEYIGERVRKDGSRFLANVVITAIRTPDGTLRAFGEITRDITERVAAEAVVKASEARLRSLIATVLDTVVDGLITIDRHGIIQSFNKACVSLFGYTPDEVIGQNVRILMPEPYHSQHDRYIAAYLATGVAKIIGIGREVMGRRKDGSTFPMELAVGESPQAGNHAFVGIVRNLTERHEADTQREQLRHSQKMEAVGQLTGGLAHDFNNLLAIIIGNLDMLREIRAEDPVTDELVRDALDSALRGADLTRRLLAFARRQPLQPERVEINEVIGAIVRLLTRTLGENITIEMSLARQCLAGADRPGAVRGGDRQSCHQCARRHAARRRAADRYPQWPARCVLRRGAYRRDARRLCRGRGQRFRHRHDARNPLAHLRAVLHHQGAGQGDRSRPLDGVRVHEAVGRPHHGVQRAGQGHDVPAVPAAHIGHRQPRRRNGRTSRRPWAAARRSLWWRTMPVCAASWCGSLARRATACWRRRTPRRR